MQSNDQPYLVLKGRGNQMPFITHNGRKIHVDSSVSPRNQEFFASMGWKNQADRDE